METTIMGDIGYRIWGIWGSYFTYPKPYSIYLRKTANPKPHTSPKQGVMTTLLFVGDGVQRTGAQAFAFSKLVFRTAILHDSFLNPGLGLLGHVPWGVFRLAPGFPTAQRSWAIHSDLTKTSRSNGCSHLNGSRNRLVWGFAENVLL